MSFSRRCVADGELGREAPTRKLLGHPSELALDRRHRELVLGSLCGERDVLQPDDVDALVADLSQARVAAAQAWYDIEGPVRAAICGDEPGREQIGRLARLVFVGKATRALPDRPTWLAAHRCRGQPGCPVRSGRTYGDLLEFAAVHGAAQPPEGIHPARDDRRLAIVLLGHGCSRRSR